MGGFEREKWPPQAFPVYKAFHMHVSALQESQEAARNGRGISYQSSSTGYFPVRQAVQWPTLLLELLELILCMEAIPSWTADTRPSTDRY